MDTNSFKRYYIITYDLNTAGYDYTLLYNEIKKLGDYYHPMDRMWMVYSEFSQDRIASRLQQCMNLNNDRVFVAEVRPAASQGWLGTKFWQWFNSEKK